MLENMKSAEVINNIDTVLIFDVDGVITNPFTKNVKEPQILRYISEQLKTGPVVFNTGRSLTWIIDRVINPLSKISDDKSILKNLFTVGEKGGTWLSIDENGKNIQNKDNSITTPIILQDQIRTLIKTKYSDSMTYDESKLTMISTEMKDGLDIDIYKERQKELTKKLQLILKKEKIIDLFNVDPSTIATDVENKRVGKGFAIKRIVNWLNSSDFKPKHFITLGDSTGDIHMAEKLQEMNLPVEFIFVGDEEKIKGKNYPFKIITTKKKYDKGTLEYLKSVSVLE